VQVPIPEKPLATDKEACLKWKVSITQAKRTNSERHSLRCDTELKLGVLIHALPFSDILCCILYNVRLSPTRATVSNFPGLLSAAGLRLLFGQSPFPHSYAISNLERLIKFLPS